MVKKCIVPPWILFKSIYLSTIVNYIDLFKTKEQDCMVSRLYDLEFMDLPKESLRKLMMDTLFICIEYRNTAAHGGRIYNYTPKSILRSHEIFSSDEIPPFHGFSQLLFLLNLLEYSRPYDYLTQVLKREVSNHCSEFPQDITYLGQVLNMNIIPKNTVFISEKSKKYHTNPHCSGIKNTLEIELEEAERLGYVPCKKCN